MNVLGIHKLYIILNLLLSGDYNGSEDKNSKFD